MKAAAQREVIQRELTILSAIFQCDRATMSAFMAPDGFGVDPDFGHKSHPELIENIVTAQIEGWDARDFDVAWVASDAYVVTYALFQAGSYRGQPLPDKMRCSTVWWRAPDGWEALAHQESHVNPLGT